MHKMHMDDGNIICIDFKNILEFQLDFLPFIPISTTSFDSLSTKWFKKTNIQIMINGKIKPLKSQISIIFKYEVLGRFDEILRCKVYITSMVVKATEIVILK